MTAYHGCKMFKCAGCGKYKVISQIHEVKTLYTAYIRESEDEYRFHIAHIALCNKCFKEAKQEKKAKKK